AASVVPSEALFVDDTDPLLVYTSNWTTDSTSQFGSFYGGTQHVCTTQGDSATLKFTGTAVWYFGNANKRHGNIQIQVDGGHSETVSTYGQNLTQQHLHWSKTDLSDREHTVVLTHADQNGVAMTIDFFRYLPSNPNSKPQSHLGVIIGGTLGAVALLALCVSMFFFLRRRKSPKPGAPNSVDLLGRSDRDIYTAVPYGQPVWGYRGHPYPSQNPHQVEGSSEFIPPVQRFLTLLSDQQEQCEDRAKRLGRIQTKTRLYDHRQIQTVHCFLRRPILTRLEV
ncbi:hypothetical protein FRC09_007262, partial [Ceratobasidium sp. 395]